MQFKYKTLLTISPIVFILDQISKYFVVQKISLGGQITVIPDLFDIVHYTNTGAAFGFLSGANSSWRVPFFYIVSALALVAIIFYIVKLKDNEKLTAVALPFVIGGIFGNGIDRIRFGHVTDFLSLHIGDKILWGVRLEWPAFNVADSAITIAMVLLIASTFRKT